MLSKPSECQGCQLSTLGTGFATSDGTGSNSVLLLGEAPGEQESLKGLAFQGDSGYLLNKLIDRLGAKRSDFLIGNVVNCRPPNNYLEGAPYEFAAIEHCDIYFTRLLEANPQIKVIVPMGNVGMWKLLGQKGIKNFHGTVHWNQRYQRWVVPTLHPSYVLRTGCKEFPTSLYDISLALRVAKQGFERTPVDYTLYPTPAVLEAFAEEYEQALFMDSSVLLAADIETAFSREIDEEEVGEKDASWEITTISFSYKPNTAITVPWTQDFLPHIQRLCSGPGQKALWNGHRFDVPRLRHAGITFNGVILDTMDAWHVLRPDLPRGLGYVAPFFTDIAPWKHLSKAEPEWYSCVDSDSLLRITLKIRAAMQRDGIWQHFLHYWTALQPRFERMSTIGIGIDEPKRVAIKRHYEEIRDNTAVLIQEQVPPELKPWLKKGGYKGKPKDVREWIKAHERPFVEGVNKDDEAWRALGYEPVAYKPGLEDLATAQDLLTDTPAPVEWRWNRREPFNHNSSQQIISYITARYGREAIPRDKKKGHPTTAADELERLARSKNDAVLNLILDAANADGKISSFITPWTPATDGRVHGVFTNTPSTHRIASQQPNVMNMPRRSEEDSLMRQMVVPGDGFEYLIEGDWKSLEAILVGWFAKSPPYIRIAYLGIHDFMAGSKLGLDVSVDMSDADLRVALKEAKKLGNSTLVKGSHMTVRDACKVSVHSGNYLEGPLLLHRTYPELFATVRDAQEYQEYYFGLFSDIPPWQQSVIDFAEQHNYVMNPWGLKRWFWNVKRWSWSKRLGKWEQKLADDAKKAIATLPQGSGGIMMRGALLNDPAQELLDRGCLMISIHDSLVARARDKQERDWVIERLRAAMEYPIIQMDNIVIPVEFKVSGAGGNWGPKSESNPLGMSEVSA